MPRARRPARLLCQQSWGGDSVRATGHLAFLYIRTVTSPPLGFQCLSPAGARRAAAVRARLRSCEHRRRGVCVFKKNNNARVLKVARNYKPHFFSPESDAYIWIKPLLACLCVFSPPPPFSGSFFSPRLPSPRLFQRPDIHGSFSL